MHKTNCKQTVCKVLNDVGIISPVLFEVGTLKFVN